MFLKLVFRSTIFSIFCFYCILLLHTSCSKESHIEISSDSTAMAKIYQPSAVAGKDVIIQSFLPDSNFANIDYLTTLAWTNAGNFNAARTLIEFDLSNIPVQTNINSATLSLFWTNSGVFTGQTGENAFSIYKIAESWQESSVTWNNQPATSVENIVNISKSVSEQQSYLNIEVTKLVQSMINNPSDNHGFMLKLDEEFPYKLVIVASSDHPDESKHPKLVVYY